MKNTALTILLTICMTLMSLSITSQSPSCLELCIGDNMFHGVNAGLANLEQINAGQSNAGQYNSFFGSYAGTANTTGDQNSFFGQASGGNSTTGSLNSFFGYNSGLNNEADRNSFFGNRAGEANTTGGNNSFFGQNAGISNSSGGQNSFFGQNSGSAYTTGFSNSFFGLFAGGSNSTGDNNSFFGVTAGRNSIAHNNSFFGQEAGYFTSTGHSNSFFGRWAGHENKSGFENTYVGTYAGKKLKGSGNVCIGFRSGPPAADSLSSRKLYIGYGSDGTLIYGDFLNQLVRVNGEFEVIHGANNGSSVHVKENFTAVDEVDILSKILALPITEWAYITKPDVRHIGPMAQDFRAAFGLGKDETSISTIDADGVSLVAIKALAQRDIDDKIRITELEKKNVKLEKTVLELLQRLEKLEKG